MNLNLDTTKQNILKEGFSWLTHERDFCTIDTAMRTARITSDDEAYYHITTRIVDRKHRFNAKENERNVSLLRRVETFSGVQVISFCFMSNHLHILLRVPRREPVSENVILDRIEVLYGFKERRRIQKRWNRFREKNEEDRVHEETKRFEDRMYDMGQFMKTLKQRLSISFNRRKDRVGTLWEERYRSILLEPSFRVLKAVSVYIDLNPVRVGLASDPQTYEFSSYGEACRGVAEARAGIAKMYERRDGFTEWVDIVSDYREHLTWKASHDKKRTVCSRLELQQAVEEKEDTSLFSYVWKQSRFFTTGIAIGTGHFIRQTSRMIQQKREKCKAQKAAPS